MPGSVTISRHHEAVMVDHTDAQRLAAVLGEVARLLEEAGPDRLTDAQVAALCGGQPHHREELDRWIRALAGDLHHRV
ncbi:hypothetical protein [Streptacidiphilus sp. ASG 303]|uniref:hypothetical protein n=1 Tax=Streptomycetaceae TaxID=2062 RepID=UPI001E2F4EB8|nr:hypothetical protein [Streptacidiphilus sp. ASG 303]MCD0483718.1 hypothetical protein [Streptacidiphilus sp. ASG 303]